MTSVYVTQTGRRYHARTDLSCMENAKSFMSIDLEAAADGGLRPCIACDAPQPLGMTEGDSQWLTAIDDWDRAGLFDSLWEQVFARRVLANTAGLSVDDVEIQAYINTGSETYKVDFYIPKARLVIEIDGYAKDGTVQTPSDEARRNRRDAALTTHGMQVLHFTNAQVQNEPITCRDQVAAALAARAWKPQSPSTATGTAAPETEQPLPMPQPAYAAHPTSPPVTPASHAGRARLLIGIALVVIVVGVVASIFIIRSGSSSPGDKVPSETTTTQSVLPSNGVCPSDYPYKGNNSSAGQRIVHAPGQQFYARTDPEICFASIAAAEASGYRQSEV